MAKKTMKIESGLVDELKKLEGELQAQNGHDKTHEDAIRFLIKFYREAK